MKNLVILGSGGFAKEVAFLVKDINRHQPAYNFIGFIDTPNETNHHLDLAGDDEWLINQNSMLSVVIGIGNPGLVKKLIAKFSSNKHLEFPNLIHPKAIGDWENIRMGKGNIVCAGNIFTTDIEIGSFNIFNLNCTLGHDARIGNYNVFNPTVNLSGGIIIGDANLIGTGAQILQYLTLDSDIIVGAGAVVNKNLLGPGTYVGIPAKKLG